MRKVLVVVVSLIALLGTSCLTPPSSGTKASAYDTTQDQRIAVLEGVINGANGLQSIVGQLVSKVNGLGDSSGLSSRISGLDSRVAVLEAKPAATGGVSTVTTDALATRIKVLEDWKAGIGTGSTNNGSTSNPAEGVISSNGNLQLILEKSVEDEVWMDDGVSQTWRLTVRNTGTSGTYFRITANFDTVEDAVAVKDATLTPDYSASSSAVFNCNNTLPATISNLSFTSSASSSSSKIYIGKGRDESMYITLKMHYSTVTGRRWTWDFTIKELS